MAQLYADENFGGRVVQELRRLGHDVLTVQEADRRGRDDAAVLADATAAGRALLTYNRRPLPSPAPLFCQSCRHHRLQQRSGQTGVDQPHRPGHHSGWNARRRVSAHQSTAATKCFAKSPLGFRINNFPISVIIVSQLMRKTGVFRLSRVLTEGSLPWFGRIPPKSNNP